RHFGCATLTIPENNRHLAHPQRSPAADYCFESNLESGGLTSKTQQALAPDGKESAHGIVHTSERVSYSRRDTRKKPSPRWPARSRPAGNITAVDNQIGFVRQNRLQ